MVRRFALWRSGPRQKDVVLALSKGYGVQRLSSFPRMLKSIRRVLAIVQQSRLMVPAVPPTRYCQQDWDSSSQVEFWLPRNTVFQLFLSSSLMFLGPNMDSNLRSERHVPKLDVAGFISPSSTHSS